MFVMKVIPALSHTTTLDISTSGMTKMRTIAEIAIVQYFDS